MPRFGIVVSGVISYGLLTCSRDVVSPTVKSATVATMAANIGRSSPRRCSILVILKSGI